MVLRGWMNSERAYKCNVSEAESPDAEVPTQEEIQPTEVGSFHIF